MDPAPVDVRLLPSDLRALARAATVDPRQLALRQLHWALRIVLLAVLAAIAVVQAVALVPLALGLALAIVEWQLRRAVRRSPAAAALDGRYDVVAAGLRRTSSIGASVIAWRGIAGLSQSGEHLFVRFAGTAWVLPFRCFSSDEHRAAFVAALQRGADAVVEPAGPRIDRPGRQAGRRA